MLRAHDERSLDLYLLVRAAASSDPWDVTRDAKVWARCLGLLTPRDAAPPQFRRFGAGKENWLQPSGFAHEYRYRLLPPFPAAPRRATVTRLRRAGS